MADDSLELENKGDSSESLSVFRELKALEEKKLENEIKRFDVAKESLKYYDEQDKRRYEFFSARSKEENEMSQTRWKSGIKIVWTLIFVAIAIIGIFMWAAFWGNETQRDTVIKFGSYLVPGIGGFGLGYYFGFRSRLVKKDKSG